MSATAPIDAKTQVNARLEMPTLPAPSHPVGKLSARINALPISTAFAAPVPADRHAATERFKRLSRGLDPNVSIAGAQPSAADILDGPISSGTSDQPEATADPKQKREKAKRGLNAKAGLNAKSVLDVVPGEANTDLFAEPEQTTPPPKPPSHPKIFDVSEGTRLDPLKNKSFDLNSAKDIPADLLTKN